MNWLEMGLVRRKSRVPRRMYSAILARLGWMIAWRSPLMAKKRPMTTSNSS